MRKLGLLVMPLMTISLLTSCGGGGDKPTPEEYTLSITLDNCKIGEESTTYTKKYIKGTTIDSISVTPNDTYVLTENSVPSKYKNYWKESSIAGTWTFSNLTMDSNHEFTISASEAATLTITLDNCKIGEESTTYTKKYIKGATIDVINVTPIEPCFFKESSISIDYKDYWSEGEDGSWVLSNLVMDSNHTIYIKGLHNYHVSVDGDKCDHLSFTTMEGKSLDTILATEGEDFKFKMKSFNDTSNSEYIIPTKIDIVINDMDPLLDGYHIESISNTEANVTIDANKVIGNIVISGEAGVKGEYHYETPYHYGLEEIPSGAKNLGEDLLITFTPIEKENNNDTYLYPKAENIYIEFDHCPVGEKKQWVSPAEELPNINEYCSYNDTTGELTIKSNHIRSNIVIVTRASDYPLLDKLNWQDIEKVSFSGVAEYIFYVGEEKTVKVNELDHEVRIIGFNHDNLVDGTAKAGITFEFKNLITDSNGKAVTTHWNDKDGDKSTNYDFPNSTLNDLLNNTKQENCIFNKLPTELQEVIKEVNKKVGIGTSYSTNEPYPTKLFPLALDEVITHDPKTPYGEGTRYQYYKNHKSEGDRVKKPVDGTNGVQYWVRSPHTSYSNTVWSVNGNGRFNVVTCIVWRDAHAVAPAFCI